ncbi:MAG: Glutamyl-tRNA reductase, partial [Bacteroidota bacterium]
KSFLLKVKDVFGVNEMLVVSTCNRTEVYYSSTEAYSDSIIKLLLTEKGITQAENYFHYFKQFDSQQNTIQHLFEVATGLHSKVVGDLQIPNQIKNAYQWSADVNMAGPFLHRLMHTIFFSNKRVAQETAFRDGAASTSYAAVALTQELTQNIINPKVLIVGLGEIGKDVCKNLRDQEFCEITLVNRTHAKALKIAEGSDFKVAKFEDIYSEVEKADVVISSVMMDKPLVTAEKLKQMKMFSYKYFIDLSVPRSIEDEIEKIPGVLVYNIDNLKERADEALKLRIAAIPHVKSIIAESLLSFNDWSKEMEVSPTINKLKNALEQIRKEEITRHLKGLTEEETDKIEKITSGIIQKIMKSPIVQLKAACKRGEADQFIGLLNDLFNLENENLTS